MNRREMLLVSSEWEVKHRETENEKKDLIISMWLSATVCAYIDTFVLSQEDH